MARPFVILLLLTALVGCARLEGGNWPSLHEGFTPREAPASAVDNTAASFDTDAALAQSVQPHQAPALGVPIDLATQVQDAKEHLERLLAQAELASEADAGAGAGTSQALIWYEAQLELSRMGRFLDKLAPYPDALADVNSFLKRTRERLDRMPPMKN